MTTNQSPPDWRGLCEKLVEALDGWHKAVFETGVSWVRPDETYLLDRARAALAAEPDGPAVPEGREPASVVGEPSDEELLAFDAWSQKAKELWGEFATERSQGTFYKELAEPNFLNMVQDSVAYPTLRQVSLMADHCGVTDLMAAKRLVYLALDTFGATSPPPVSVTERLPRPEDCDAEGRCYAWDWLASDWRMVPAEWVQTRGRRIAMRRGGVTRGTAAESVQTKPDYNWWLPATALPIPQGEVE